MTIDIFSLIIGAIIWELVSTYLDYKIKERKAKHKEKAQKQTKKSKNDSNNNSKEES